MPYNLLDTDCENKELLEVAFTHPSYTKEQELSYTKSYERLEFLGDAVLKLTISKLLYQKYPNYEEGELSKIRSVLVSDSELAKLGKTIGLDKHLRLGTGEENTGGRSRESNIACSMEAVFGVYYLEDKTQYVERFLQENLLSRAEDIEHHFEKYNAKAVLQEYTQAQNGELPCYEVIKTKGPAHKPTFVVEVSYLGEVLAEGSGKTKKEAQQSAALEACRKLAIID